MISEQTVASDAPVQYLTFSIRDEVFAMDIRRVREIIQYNRMTPVPHMPEFVRGVINLRGQVVPVIDLHSRFGRGRSNVGKKTCIIIFDGSREGERLELGLMVDSVSEVIDIAPNMIEETPQFGTPINRDYIHGMGKVGPKFVIILEPDRALNIDDMAGLVEPTHAPAHAV